METARQMKTNRERGGGEKQTAPIKLSFLIGNWKI